MFSFSFVLCGSDSFLVFQQVEPTPLNSVDFSQRGPMQNAPPNSKGKKRFLAEYNPVAPNKRKVDVNNYQTLVARLNQAQPDSPFLGIADDQRWSSSIDVIAIQPDVLPDKLPFSSPLLVPCADISVETSPPHPNSFMDTVKTISKDEMQSLSEDIYASTQHQFRISQTDKEAIEKLTIGQQEMALWYHYRKGVVTGSIIHSVHTRMKSIQSGKSTEANRLVKMVANDTDSKFKGNKATRYGIANEANAALAYEARMKLKHKDFALKQCGLHLLSEHSFLGGSPDRIATCACHEPWIVEIKCPARMSGDKNSCKFEDLPFLQKATESEKLNLKKSHEYYSQIMWYAGITGLTGAALVVWSPKDFFTFNLDFDVEHYSALLSSALYFVREFLLPKLLSDLSRTSANGSATTARDQFVRENACNASSCYRLLLSSDNIVSEDDNSVMCECDCQCQKWFHWKCCDFESRSDPEDKWQCMNCIDTCKSH